MISQVFIHPIWVVVHGGPLLVINGVVSSLIGVIAQVTH